LADADLSDADYYARYLVTRGRAQLTSSLTPTPLPTLLAPGSGDDELLAALRGLMGTVRQALAALETARVWGEYAFTRASMAQRLEDAGPLGRSDLARLAESTVRHAIPRAGRRVGVSPPRPVYTALGPALRSHREWQDKIRGADYPMAVCHANSVLSDYARREQDETTGLLPWGVRLSLDDRWQGGGVWRTVFTRDDANIVPSHDSVDEPAGRGWVESFPQQLAPQAPWPPAPRAQPHHVPQGYASLDVGTGPDSVTDAHSEAPEGAHFEPGALTDEHSDVAAPPVSVPVAEPAAAEEGAPHTPWPDDGDLGSPIRLAANDSQVEWAQPLRLSHVLEEYLPLPGHFADELLASGATAGPVRVVLHHAGYELPAGQMCHDTRVTVGQHGTRLDGIAWPLDLFPGIWLTFIWQRGSRVVDVRTTLLPQPMIIDGELIEHRYDPRVLTRDGFNGLSAEPEPTGEPARQLMTAIRRLGLLDQFGRALLNRTDVPSAVRAITGDVHIEASSIEAALTELLAAERLTVTRVSRSGDGRTYYPPRPGEPIVELVCYRPHRVDVKGGSPGGESGRSTSAVLGQSVQEHEVAGFLRRIGHLGHEATEEQRARYREDHRRFRLSGPDELPPGFTYVRPHKRGR
jgi:hypothetical protein